MTPQELKNSILQLAIQGKLVEQRPEEGTAKELFVRIQEEKLRLIAEKKSKKKSRFLKSPRMKSHLIFPRVGCGCVGEIYQSQFNTAIMRQLNLPVELKWLELVIFKKEKYYGKQFLFAIFKKMKYPIIF